MHILFKSIVLLSFLVVLSHQNPIDELDSTTTTTTTAQNSDETTSTEESSGKYLDNDYEDKIVEKKSESETEYLQYDEAAETKNQNDDDANKDENASEDEDEGVEGKENEEEQNTDDKEDKKELVETTQQTTALPITNPHIKTDANVVVVKPQHKTLNKNIAITCQLETFQLDLKINVISDEKHKLQDRLSEEETHLNHALCHTANQTDLTIEFNEFWSLKLNFSRNFTTDETTNHRNYELKNVQSQIKNDVNSEFVLTSHLSKIECSNNKETKIVSKIIMNVGDVYRADIQVECINSKKQHSAVKSNTVGYNAHTFFFIVIATCICIVVIFTMVGFYLNKNLKNSRDQKYNKINHSSVE